MLYGWFSAGLPYGLRTVGVWRVIRGDLDVDTFLQSTEKPSCCGETSWDRMLWIEIDASRKLPLPERESFLTRNAILNSLPCSRFANFTLNIRYGDTQVPTLLLG